MTITTNLSRKYSEKEFSRRPATLTREITLTIAAGAALTGLGIWRRRWFGSTLTGAGGYLLYRGIADLRRTYQGSARMAFTIAKGRQEIYDFISNAENWPRFLHRIQLRKLGAGRVCLGFGDHSTLRFESRVEMTDHKHGEFIAWASAEEVLEHRGVIRLKQATDNRGTEISVALEYKAPAGPIARGFASLAGWNPEQLVRESLRHLKQILEAGEIPTTVGQPVGARGMKGAAVRMLYRERPIEPAAEQARIAGD